MLRIGLLLDRPISTKYIHDFVLWAHSRPDISVDCLILCPTPKTGTTPYSKGKLRGHLKRHRGNIFHLVKFLTTRAVFRAILAFERKLLSKSALHRDHADDFDLAPLVPKQLQVTPIISGFIYRFSPADIEKIRSLNLDILIRCASGILKGEILTATKFGVLSFHHADNRINRGQPAGFWEVYLRQDTSGFIIQRLTEELDGGDVIMRGHVQTQYYYLLNQAALYYKSNYYLKKTVEKVATTGALPPILPHVPYSHKLYRQPTLTESVIYAAKLAEVVAKNGFAKLLGLRHRWSVAIVQGDWRSAVLWRGREISNPPFRYLADPFVVSRDDMDVCFVESLDLRSDIGRIDVYQLEGGGSRFLGTALDEPFHLSFPFVFEHDGALYMCPESSMNHDIRIYKCVDFPLKWELVKVVMKGLSAVDTMFIPWKGKWWLLTAIDTSGSNDHFEMSIFWSETLFGDRWIPHPQNPIFVDARRARNAGLLKDGDRYFRVSQSPGFHLYGKQSSINEIKELSEERYAEEPVVDLMPQFRPDQIGIHHLHSNGRLTAFDILRLSRIR